MYGCLLGIDMKFTSSNEPTMNHKKTNTNLSTTPQQKCFGIVGGEIVNVQCGPTRLKSFVGTVILFTLAD